MTPELQDLGRRAVACKGWRWMEGMKPVHIEGFGYKWGTHIPSPDKAGVLNQDRDAGHVWWVPDLSDPATLGCLLALVREVHSDPVVSIEWDAVGYWECWGEGAIGFGPFASEAEALVAALEACS